MDNASNFTIFTPNCFFESITPLSVGLNCLAMLPLDRVANGILWWSEETVDPMVLNYLQKKLQL